MTRLVRFANNATSKLASNLPAVGLTMSVTPGDGAKFPALTAGQFFKATLIKNDGTKEVVKVTARTSDTMTIARANEAVGGVQTAYPFSAGDKVELRLTATALGDELDRLDAAAFLDVVNKSANYTITEADISKLIKTDTSGGTVTITLPQISTLTGSFEVQISKNTSDGNGVTIARAGSDTINGSTSYVLASQYQCVWLVADLATGTWTAITSANASNKIADQFIGAGTAGPFTLSGDPGSKNNTEVYVSGVYQNKSTYSVAGTQLTLGVIVAAGVIVECNWTQPLPIGTPSDGTVTTAKLADGTVTIAKLGDSVKAAIQSQAWTAATTAGTSTAYTITQTPVITAYAANISYWVTFHTASGATPTLQISGVATPPNLVKQDATGAYVNIQSGDIPTNHRSRVTLISATQALVEELPPSGHQPGQVCFFAQNTAPSGFLKANGALVSRTTYAALFAAIGTTYGVGDGSTTFNLPDLRGEFIRGFDDGRGVDTGRVLGSAQAQGIQSHSHTINPVYIQSGGNVGGHNYLVQNGSGPWATGATGDTETRPRNVALLVCIKF